MHVCSSCKEVKSQELILVSSWWAVISIFWDFDCTLGLLHCYWKSSWYGLWTRIAEAFLHVYWAYRSNKSHNQKMRLYLRCENVNKLLIYKLLLSFLNADRILHHDLIRLLGPSLNDDILLMSDQKLCNNATYFVWLIWDIGLCDE